MSYHIIIPARLDSTRLPKKMLMDIDGKSMIQRVYERALLTNAKTVTIATDSDEIANVAKRFGANFCITSKDHNNGSERLSEAAFKLGLADNDIVVNLQGDEPLIEPENINIVANLLEEDASANVSTIAIPIQNVDEFKSPNIVKVVLDSNNCALMFSRSSIPGGVFLDANNGLKFSDIESYKHVGIYGYRAKTLCEYNKLKPSPLEKLERLEQLRFLWHGNKIKVGLIKSSSSIAVDILEDIEKVRRVYEGMRNNEAKIA